MSGQDGINVIRIDWQQFKAWQSWDEWPERVDDPPMTVDMQFWYASREYNLDRVNYEYAILDENWQIIVSNKNFLSLLNTPVEIWDNKSFKDIIEDAEFLD